VLAQPKQALAVLAERVHADRNGSAVGPQRQVAYEMNALILAVAGGITTEQKGDGP
jgi:hypothetical protein